MQSYRGRTDVLTGDGGVDARAIEDLQRDLRALGYYDGDISGVWSGELEAAILAIRYDLTHPDQTVGASTYNRGRLVVAAPATGAAAVEPVLAACIGVMADDPNFVKLPASERAAADNRRAWERITAMRDGVTPTPFMVAIFTQLSGGRHFETSGQARRDGFVGVALHHGDAAAAARITARGYGIGRYTLAHHPPTNQELNRVILDLAGNTEPAFARLRRAFDGVLANDASDGRAADRLAERPISPLRTCKYARTDVRYLADCRTCAAKAGTTSLHAGQPVYPGAALVWAATTNYASAGYADIPDRSGFPCDWPYAARRYAGDDIDSYHFQAHVLINLLTPS